MIDDSQEFFEFISFYLNVLNFSVPCTDLSPSELQQCQQAAKEWLFQSTNASGRLHDINMFHTLIGGFLATIKQEEADFCEPLRGDIPSPSCPGEN